MHSEGMGHILSAEGGYWGGGGQMFVEALSTLLPLVVQSVISLS